MGEWKLADGEYRFAELVWENEPINSTELTKVAYERLGWKKSTCYTVLRKLCERGILRNQNATVTALVKREQMQKQESEDLLKKSFGNSLPVFLTAFLKDKKLSQEEADQIQRLIDEARR
ncbi:MAG: BlaI/MecI/CopY family transcriptional regulator [Lachnospiraceae bacterium]|nr:BlaI/MecI/CopY family transcriptional regulator [Lachnospiraceae bacterium]